MITSRSLCGCLFLFKTWFPRTTPLGTGMKSENWNTPTFPAGICSMGVSGWIPTVMSDSMELCREGQELLAGRLSGPHFLKTSLLGERSAWQGTCCRQSYTFRAQSYTEAIILHEGLSSISRINQSLIFFQWCSFYAPSEKIHMILTFFTLIS